MTSLRTAILAGLVLGLGTLALQLLDLWMLPGPRGIDGPVALLAGLFLCLGFWLGREMLWRSPSADMSTDPIQADAGGLSARELDVLRQVAAGRSTGEIATALGVSSNTVKTHIANLFAKLGARRRTEAVSKARAAGILA